MDAYTSTVLPSAFKNNVNLITEVFLNQSGALCKYLINNEVKYSRNCFQH